MPWKQMKHVIIKPTIQSVLPVLAAHREATEATGALFAGRSPHAHDHENSGL